MFETIKKGIAELVYDGGLASVAIGNKMDTAEAAISRKFNNFVDRRVMEKANSAARALESSQDSETVVGKSRIAAGHILGRSAGGAVIGAGVNGYEYSQTGSGFGGSYSMTESVLSGAVAGAIGGGLIGSLGAKRAVATAKANRAGLEQRYNKAMSVVEKRGLLPFGSGKGLEEGAVTKLNEGADLSNRTSFWTKGINGNSNNPGSRRLNGPQSPFGGNDPGTGLAVGSSVRPINPNRGGGMLALPHSQSNMNTMQIPKQNHIL